ncbi:hypothetical protein AACH06_03880 [Ideonella sp. DXS29W]|uniref:Uncharacterized protein n=1 Tax=Ideonella lacteola TaxID=2984193 RepID=A0ABU9BJ08_9BURK
MSAIASLGTSLLGGSATSGILQAFKPAMDAEMAAQMGQELQQMKDNREMDQLKHIGQLAKAAGDIAG